MCVHLPKGERKVKLSYFFPYELFLFCFYFKGSYCVWGEVKGEFSSLFMHFFFLSPCLLVLRVIIHRGLFNCQMQQKVIRPLLFPAPTLAFSSKQKQPLLGMVIISQGFFFIPQVRNALLLHIQVTSYKHRETQDVAADALPWMMLPINTCHRCSESFLFFQAGFLTYYKNCLSIYLQCITHH